MAPRALPSSLLTARAVVSRGCLRTLSPGFVQKRCIGMKYLAKVEEAEKAWNLQAIEINAGRKKHLFDEFEDRGFIKDLVG